MEMSGFLTSYFNLTKVIPENIATHAKGASLDGLWSTLEATSCVIVSDLSQISDHSLILTKFRIGKEIKRTIPHRVDEFVTSADFRWF